MAADSIRVEIAYATSERQVIIAIELPHGSQAEQAITASDILQQFPEIDLTRQAIGIFGQTCKLQQCLNDGDRVEIYRPLKQDPMSARRNRLK